MKLLDCRFLELAENQERGESLVISGLNSVCVSLDILLFGSEVLPPLAGKEVGLTIKSSDYKKNDG